MERNETGLPTEPRASMTSIDEDRRDWAYLPLPVVDSLVRVLKSTRRWKLEGRSLRLLNRHWSTAATMHVEEIRPHRARSIVDEDVASLPKFQRVTSVDISSFLIRPPRHAIPRDHRQKRLFFENWYDTKLERIVDVLCQLPKLTQIEVGVKVLIAFHYQCPRAREQLSRLGRITSVYFYGEENLKVCGMTHLNTTPMWPTFHAPADCSRTLAKIVGSLKRLESLEVGGSLLNRCQQFDFLDEMKSVKLHDVDFRLVTRLPNPSATTVSSIVMESEDGFALDTCAHPNRFVGLGLMRDHQEHLNQLCRSRVARYLKVLSIEGSWGGRVAFIVPNEAYHTFEQLERLNIRSSNLDGASLRGKLPNLKALRIANCKLTDSDATFVTQFRKLELLSWQNICSPNLPYPESLLRLPWRKMELANLRFLCVVPIHSDSDLMIISQQTNLEGLRIGSRNYCHSTGTVTEKGMRALENLHNLRMLQLRTLVTQRRVLLSLLSTNLVTKLEQLWLPYDADHPKIEKILKRIRRSSPHAILRVGLS